MEKIIQRQRTVLKLLGPMKGRYVLLYVLAGLSAILEMVSVGLVLPLIGAITQNNTSIQLPATVALLVEKISDLSLLYLAGILFAVFAAKNAFKLLALYGNSKIVEEIRGEWMTALFNKYVQQHYLFFVSTKHGVLMFNMFDLCQRVMYGLRQLVGLFLHGFGLLLTLLFLAVISWQATVVSLVVLALAYGIVQRPMLARSSALGKNVLASYHEASALASEVMRGIREVKAYGAAADLRRQYGDIVTRMVKGSVKIALFEVVPTVIPEVLLVFLLFLAVALLGQKYANGGIDTLLPLLGTFLYGLYRVFVQGSTVARTSVAFTSHWASIHRLAEELTNEAHKDTSEGSDPHVEQADSLTCDHVFFSYDQHIALRDISLHFRHGEITAIVGDSGAGKSTLVDLLIRLLTPDKGGIRYGDKEISEYTLAAWRNAVALVSQDVFLFHGTIRENLIIGLPEGTSDERIREALRLAGAEEFVDNLPDGLDTMIGERGFKLSGGQRQRIAIARALVRRPHILLLDEATSALDAQTESALLKTLHSLKDRLMIIAITHRLSVAKGSDCIYVLRGGSVVESGTHRELIGRQSIYRSLYEHGEE